MHTHTTVFAVMTFLHNLFTAAWLGGLLAMVFTFMPAARKTLGKGPELKQLIGLIQKRQSLIVTVSLIGLALTGLLLTKRSPTQGVLFSFGSIYATLLSVKHILYLSMIILAGLRTLLSRKQKHAAGGMEAGSAGQPVRNTAMVLMLVNAVIGVLVLLLSSILSVMDSVPAG
ncbi:MAG: hypothetical protein JXA25_11855 [Anaerolineales bacterium]|nr:hypothetical protein [Anaerolineales bacterium]